MDKKQNKGKWQDALFTNAINRSDLFASQE